MPYHRPRQRTERSDLPLEPEREIMPFGKHKGEMLADIPIEYMEWCLENLDLRPRLRNAMESTVEMLR